jgi:hypothetical protein
MQFDIFMSRDQTRGMNMKLKPMLSVLLLTLPGMASAFSIMNATDIPLTVSVNDICSTADVQPQRETVLSDGEIMNLCGRLKKCPVKIYDWKNCMGTEKGSVELNDHAWVQQSPVTSHRDYNVKVIYYMNLVAVGWKH